MSEPPTRLPSKRKPHSPSHIDPAAQLEQQCLYDEMRARLFGEPRPAVRVGNYGVLHKLGSGGSGTVFAVCGPDDRRYALKLVDSDDPRALARLRREGRAMSALAHPHIVRIHEIGTHQNAVYVVLDLIDGVTLREWLREPRSWPEIFACLLPILDGLAAAHARGILHRDLKPDNILVQAPLHAWLLDFGLAKPLPGSEAQGLTHMSQALTNEGELLGTVGYIAPELLLAHPIDARADQYSICVVLWEALYGSPPFAGRTVLKLGLAVLKGEIPPIESTDVPIAIEAVLRRGLRPEPDDRYPSIQALAEALRQAARQS